MSTPRARTALPTRTGQASRNAVGTRPAPPRSTSLARPLPPPPPPPTPASPWRRPLVLGVVVAAATLYTALMNPNPGASTNLFLPCPTKWLTGWDCPFCGGLRAVHSLTHGQFVAAVHHNVVFVLCAPFLVASWALWLARGLGWRVPTLRWPRWATVATVAFLAAFTVARNLPFPATHWMFSSST